MDGIGGSSSSSSVVARVGSSRRRDIREVDGNNDEDVDSKRVERDNEQWVKANHLLDLVKQQGKAALHSRKMRIRYPLFLDKNHKAACEVKDPFTRKNTLDALPDAQTHTLTIEYPSIGFGVEDGDEETLHTIMPTLMADDEHELDEEDVWIMYEYNQYTKQRLWQMTSTSSMKRMFG